MNGRLALALLGQRAAQMGDVLGAPQQATPVVEWQRFFDQDHNPDFNPHGVEVWKMTPQGEPPDVLRELFWKKMRELDPDGTRWRGSHLYTGSDPDMQPIFRLRRPPPASATEPTS